MLLHCLRHGASVANLAHRFNPEGDPLHESAVAVLRSVAPLGGAYDRVYVSPLPRAVQTAEHLGLAGWAFEPRISERRLGVFVGLTAAECATRHAGAFAAFQRLEAEPAIPGGESRGEHLARVTDWLGEACSTGADRVLAVTHGGVVDFIYRMATGLPPHGGEYLFCGENLGLSTFEVVWPDVRLIAFSAALAPAAPDRYAPPPGGA